MFSNRQTISGSQTINSHHGSPKLHNPFLVEAGDSVYYHSGKQLIVYNMRSATARTQSQDFLEADQYVWLFGAGPETVMGIIDSTDPDRAQSIILYDRDDPSIYSTFTPTPVYGKFFSGGELLVRFYAAIVTDEHVILAGSLPIVEYLELDLEALEAGRGGAQSFEPFAYAKFLRNGPTRRINVYALGYLAGEIYFLAQEEDGPTWDPNLPDYQRPHLSRDREYRYDLVSHVPSLPPTIPSQMLVHQEMLFFCGSDRLYYYSADRVGDGSLDFGLPTYTEDRIITSLASNGRELYIGYEDEDENGTNIESFIVPPTLGSGTFFNS